MADNIAVTAGSGTTVAADDIGSVYYQRIKVTYGADGSATDASPASPLPVLVPTLTVTVTPTLDTSAYANGDTLFATTAISGAVRIADAPGTLVSVAAIDKDDVGESIDLHFFSSNVTFGTANAVPSISDADAANYLGTVTINSADWYDLGGNRVATKTGSSCGFVVTPASGTTTVYVAATVTSGAGTHTASGLVLKFGFSA